MTYYIDARVRELITEEDITEYMAPETYYKYLCNGEDIYIENWFVGDGKALSFAFTQLSVDNQTVNMERKYHFKRHNAKAQYLISYIVPPAIYAEVLKEYGYDVEE